MSRLCLLLVATICTFLCLPPSGASQLVCSSDAGKIHRLTISISSTRSESGEWKTGFSASQNMSNLPKNIDLDLTRAVVECQGNHFINIQAIIKDSSTEKQNDSLFFHNRCSSNAAITDNSRTLQKLKPSDTASALTDRPLLNNEIFTIRLDKKGTDVNHAFGIGITTHSPNTLEVPNHMNTLKSGIWMFYHSNIYINSVATIQGFWKPSLDSLKVGQRIGVMRSKSGTLHFFLDGVDQGPAASNIPDNVYGVFELYGSGLQGTIIDA